MLLHSVGNWSGDEGYLSNFRGGVPYPWSFISKNFGVDRQIRVVVPVSLIVVVFLWGAAWIMAARVDRKDRANNEIGQLVDRR